MGVFCRTIFLQKSNIQNQGFTLFRLHLKYVNFVNLSGHILNHFTRKNIRYFICGGAIILACDHLRENDDIYFVKEAQRGKGGVCPLCIT